MSFLTEIVWWGLSFLIFLFASPIVFESIGLGGSTGASGFVAAIFPWVLVLVFIGRGVYVFRTGGRIV